ncbi:MAG TPA: CopD family protein [Polyangiaceae bacterium]|nr:CopD family protein [Polyangiaceae bacterium]
MLANLLVTLHVTANLVWIGAIACVGWLVASASKTNDASTAVLARGLYLRVAVPAFLASFVFGASRLAMDPSYYMHLHWFHGKLTVALVVIALHHVIGAKARKVAGGSMHAGASGGILVGALLACAFLSVTLVVFRQALVP